jgi:hypothetical protein
MRPQGDRVDLIDRLGRPLLRLCGVVFAIVLVVIVARIGNAVVMAFERAAIEGRPVPDMSGGLPGILSGLAVAVPAIGAFILDQITRHRERTRQIDRGWTPNPPQPPPGPSPAAEPSPSGGLVNNDAIR